MRNKHLSMRPVRSLIPLLLAAFLAVAPLAGCATLSGMFAEKEPAAPPPEPTDVMAAGYNANALHNFYMGRQYVAQGRYELAREHFLLAIASADGPELQESLTAELHAVDRLIRTLR